MSSKATVAILTNFMDFNPGYSLSGIVVDQALMLLRNGHKVHVFVNEQFNDSYNDDARINTLLNNYSDKFFIQKKTKFMHLTDYKTKESITQDHKMEAMDAGAMLAQALEDIGAETVYTHDWIFTGWNLPYSFALKMADKKLMEKSISVKWYHWIHSVPSANSDWWRLEEYGSLHCLVFPNRTSIMQVVEQFHTTPAKARIIPHIKDIRTWYDFSQRTMEFIDYCPDLMESSIIQIYPCSSDRLDAKQLDIVIRIFGFFKKLGNNVCLVAANQWATGKQPMQNVQKYIALAHSVDLQYGKDFLFTSEYLSDPDFGKLIYLAPDEKALQKLLLEGKRKKYCPQEWGLQGDDLQTRKDSLCEWVRPYAKGIDRRMLRELQLLSSVFIFPTREESFGLVGPESAYSGCLNINNRSLIMMSEVMGHMAPAFDFGSHHLNHPPSKEDDYLRAVALAIIARLNMNESVQTKIHCRTRYSMDNIYTKFYLPLTLV